MNHTVAQLVILYEMVEYYGIHCLHEGILLALTHRIHYEGILGATLAPSIPLHLHEELKKKLLYYYPDVVLPALAGADKLVFDYRQLPNHHCYISVMNNWLTMFIAKTIYATNAGTRESYTIPCGNEMLKCHNIVLKNRVLGFHGAEASGENCILLYALRQCENYTKFEHTLLQKFDRTTLRKITGHEDIESFTLFDITDNFCIIDTLEYVFILKFDDETLTVHAEYKKITSFSISHQDRIIAVTPDMQKLS